MLRKLFILFLIGLLIFICLDVLAVRQISIVTAGLAGTYYPVGTAIAKVISDNVESLQVTVERDQRERERKKK